MRRIKKYLRQIDKVERKNIIEKHEINKKNYYIPLKLKNNIKENYSFNLKYSMCLKK